MRWSARSTGVPGGRRRGSAGVAGQCELGDVHDLRPARGRRGSEGQNGGGRLTDRRDGVDRDFGTHDVVPDVGWDTTVEAEVQPY